jgi:hypothetical protein
MPQNLPTPLLSAKEEHTHKRQRKETKNDDDDYNDSNNTKNNTIVFSARTEQKQVSRSETI